MSVLALVLPWFKAEGVRIPLPISLPFLGDSFPIQPFGILVTFGCMFGLRVVEAYARRARIVPAYAYHFALCTLGAGFVGAVVLNTVFYFPERLPRVFTNPGAIFSGLSSYGGFFGAVVGILLWRRRHRVPILAVADASAFSFPFGWFFGRLGCFVVHDHPGRVSHFFLAVDGYRVGEPPFLPRHDLGLYEVLWSFAMAMLFLVLWRKPRPGGFYLSLIILLYAPIRFLLDFLRAESSEGGDVRYLGLTPGQYSSIVFLFLGAYLLRVVMSGTPSPIPDEARLDDEDEAADAAPAAT